MRIGVDRIELLLAPLSAEVRESRKADREVAAAEQLLGRMIGRDPATLTWEYGPQGKPEIPELLPLRFNLAHSGDLAACAIAPGRIGVDLEKIAAPRESLLRRFFLPWEQKLVDEAEDPGEMFTALWTIREAVCKWDGQGMGYFRRVKDYHLRENAAGECFAWADGEPACRVETYRMPGYMLTVAADPDCFVSCPETDCCDKLIRWKVKLPKALSADMQEDKTMSDWKVITPEELQGNVFTMINNGWMLVTAAKEDGTVNTMTASWGGVGILWNRKVAFVFIRPTRYTKEFVDGSAKLSLSFYDEKYRSMLTYMGRVSGRDENKIEKMGLTVAMDGDVPYFEEASLVLECRKLYAQEMESACFIDKDIDNKTYSQNDYHTMYVVEIEKILER